MYKRQALCWDNRRRARGYARSEEPAWARHLYQLQLPDTAGGKRGAHLSIGGKVGGNDVHVIPGSDRFLLFLNGHFLQVRHFALDVSDCLCLVDRLDMQVDGHGIV